MEKLLQYLSGYVEILLQGEALPRFLNLCRSRNLVMRKVKATEQNRIIAIVSVDDFFRLKPIHDKTKVRIHILRRHGLPFFLYRNRKKKPLPAAFLAGVAVIVWLSGHIWTIQMEGNSANTTPEILRFLKENGITWGMRTSQVDCSGIAAMVREEYDDMTWVSARIEGTRLILSVREGNTAAVEEQEASPCSIRADISGEIVEMVTRSGVPQVQTGDTIQEGDLLVSGYVDILNDSQEVVRQERVHADADIYVRYQLSYYREISMTYQKQIFTGREMTSFYLRIGSWYLSLAGTLSESRVRTAEEFPWKVTESMTLPVSFGRITDRQYEFTDAQYTEAEAKAAALGYFQIYEAQLLEKGIQISENHVKIETDQDTCVSSGTLTVIAKTGTEVPLESADTSESRESSGN